jgi:hypothetical protein
MKLRRPLVLLELLLQLQSRPTSICNSSTVFVLASFSVLYYALEYRRTPRCPSKTNRPILLKVSTGLINSNSMLSLLDSRNLI